MKAIVTFATSLTSTVSSRFARLLRARPPKLFSNLPDDVLLQVVLDLDFSEIIALRQAEFQIFKSPLISSDADRFGPLDLLAVLSCFKNFRGLARSVLSDHR